MCKAVWYGGCLPEKERKLLHVLNFTFDIFTVKLKKLVKNL